MLDEADRILDMGFRTQLDGILQYLPPRQTMLFSATQTKSVKDLARLSLNNPQYVAVHAQDKEVTPKQLLQNYVTVSAAVCLSYIDSGWFDTCALTLPLVTASCLHILFALTRNFP